METENQDVCALCGSKHLLHCYGIAFGGLGPYAVCEDCDEVIWKKVNEPGQCLAALEKAHD